ncbi:MAG TPA: c-type cytochrome biogenesis protein CcmI [Pyrinomonadaceae bacterium]
MIFFWIVCAALIAIALAFILPTLLDKSAQPAAPEERKEANVAVYRDQLTELKADLQNGIISQEQFAQDSEEIERRLLEDLESKTPVAKKAEPASGNATSEVAISLVNLGIYHEKLTELKAALKNGIISQEQFTQDSEELQRSLLEHVEPNTAPAKKAEPKSRNAAYALAVAIPLVAVIFYVQVGSPKAIGDDRVATPEAPPMAAGGGGQRTQAQIEANVQKLADKLKANPSDPAGWIMLARSYNSMERYGEATGAYAKAVELNPNDADIWAEYAFATAMANDRKLEGKPTELINQALKVDPQNPKALQLAGTAAFDAKDYKKAIEIWQRVLSRVPPGSDVAQAINDRINEAKKLAGTK